MNDPAAVTPERVARYIAALQSAGAILLRAGEEAYHRGEWRRAIDAFKQALAKDPGNPVALTHLGMTLIEGGHFDQALTAFDQALVRDSDYSPALFAKGIVLSDGKQDYAGAIKIWERLVTPNLPPADADRVRGLIAEARRKLSGRATGRALDPTPRTEISGTVEVASALQGKVPRVGALFLIARKGPGPPLAVKRFVNPAFPLNFVLGPEDRMAGNAPFVGEVTLIARLKQDGLAGPPSPGDLEGRAPTPVRVGRREVEIVLDRAY